MRVLLACFYSFFFFHMLLFAFVLATIVNLEISMLFQSEERQQIFYLSRNGNQDAIKFVFPDLYCFLNFPLSLPVLFIGYFGKTRNPKLKFRVSKMSGIIFQDKFGLSLFTNSNF